MKSCKTFLWIFFCVLFLLPMTACSFSEGGKKTDQKQVSVDFTVVEEADCPEELLSVIEKKKEMPFKLTYNCEGYLYIVQGYGAQQTGGYSITVDALNETENALYFDTTLLGPEKDEEVDSAVSYPYIVVKIEDKEKSVVFLS